MRKFYYLRWVTYKMAACTQGKWDNFAEGIIHSIIVEIIHATVNDEGLKSSSFRKHINDSIELLQEVAWITSNNNGNQSP
jgi:hypothetical protein